MPMSKRAAAEFFGTFWLVFGGCGAAVLAAGVPNVGIGYAGVALAFGLPFLPVAFAIGHISGRHINPAVTVGLVAAGVLYVIASGNTGFNIHNGFALNGYGNHSPNGYSLLAGFVAEVVLTAFFLIVIMGAPDERAPKGFAPIAIGLCLTLIHLVGIPVTNLSVNPARSTGPAVFAGGWALEQLWMFWVAPLIGGAIGGVIFNTLFGARGKMPVALHHDVRGRRAVS